MKGTRFLLLACLLAAPPTACSTVQDLIPNLPNPRALLGRSATAKRVARIAILPLAYRDGQAVRPCDLCPDRVVMDVTSERDALLVTAFLYEALARHPRLQVVPYEAVEAVQGESMQETLTRLAESEKLDAVVVGAVLELRDRMGDPRDPAQRGGAAVYVALLDLPSGRPVWKRLYDRTPGRPNRAMRQYERLIVGETSKAMTAHEVAHAGVNRMVSGLVRAVR